MNDVAVMAYREAYGGEVRTPRFLRQYRGKSPGDPLRSGRDIKNIAGATLSVDAAEPGRPQGAGPGGRPRRGRRPDGRMAGASR